MVETMRCTLAVDREEIEADARALDAAHEETLRRVRVVLGEAL
jgi:hypothetical protein